MNTLTYISRQGNQIESVFDDLAGLRIAVFRDFPYLYEGSVLYEKEYLKTYSQSDRAFLFAVYDHQQMIGATTCIPLEDETEEVKLPFEQAGRDIESIFYFGESILLPQYRGIGLGHRFFDEREKHVHQYDYFKTTCFCAVERDVNHPLKPSDYRPNDAFWRKRGYQKDHRLQSTFQWKDVGEKLSSSKSMVYWLKNWEK